MYQYLKNHHEGETMLVIGNGPSLRDVPPDFFELYPTFGTNRIYRKLIPDYYVVINPLVIEQNRDEIERLDTTKFVRAGMGLAGYQLRKRTSQTFSLEPLEWIHEGWTVTYPCLQLARWMGAATVLLVGIDHRYTFDGAPNQTLHMQGDDPNHYDPEYFKGQDWQAPDLERSAKCYAVAREVYEREGRRIINLTEGSALDVFEKGSIEEWV